MASIRPKGKAFEIRYYAGRDGSGNPIRRSKTFRGSLRGAEAEANLLEGGYRNEPKEVTFGKVLTAWVAHGGRRSEATQARVARRVGTHIQPALGHLAATSITPAVLEGFYRQLLSRGLSEGTVRNLHWDISGSLRRAVRDGIVARNAAEAVELHLSAPARVEPPAIADVQLLLKAVDAAPGLAARELALAVRVCLASGARRGEMCGLRWGDVDFEGHALHLRHNVVRYPKGLVVKEPKAGSRRVVAVPEVITARLAAHRELMADFLPRGDRDFVLVSADHPGGPSSPERLTQRFMRWRNSLGLTFRFHDLRHLAVSMFLADMPVFAASSAAGHRRTSTTTDIYGHLIDPGLDRRTAEAVAKRIDL